MHHPSLASAHTAVCRTRFGRGLVGSLIGGLALTVALVSVATAGALDEVKERGVLRHLGVPYANFVTGAGDGMDVELMRAFAAHLGVRYEFVKSDWGAIIGDLIGRKVASKGDDYELLGETPIRGDVIANGMTVIPWRAKVVAFAAPTFPTQVWLVSRADLPVSPIRPSAVLDKDIAATKALMPRRTLLGKANTCLDPELYDIKATGAKVTMFQGTLNELAPAVINGESELTLLDVPDALVALQKWPGEIKVIGPVSERQDMAPAFRPADKDLRESFNQFLKELKASGEFTRIALRYYPFVVDYFPDFLPKPR
ncbi:transporter substrate-binding domain-containing protein [uncultured Thiodictyon sp.]|uniref:transporter substrate-binding domain-containing protein n=1 Tax=uncultured Thiodictyon sp. TaxID=1846217 RepID=UPI0025FD9A12|nr:transporter substrate-binding domain-containing protein [uncultured Thiodictyon sp.]